MTDTTISQFKNELNSFFWLVLLNMVFGALAMAFGIQFVISAVMGLPLEPTMPGLRVLAGAIAMAGFGLGLSWVLSSAKVFLGINGIRREFRKRTLPVPDDMLTSGIVRMLAHYRENQKILLRMITICRLGGCVFIALGLANIVWALSFGSVSGTTRTVFALGTGIVFALPFVDAAINLTIGTVTIAISIGFHQYSLVWDRRLEKNAENETTLKETMEQ